MRVHHIISNYSKFTGGAPRVVRALHLGLQKKGIESYILGLMEQKDANINGAQSLGLKSPYDVRAFHGIHRYLAKNVKAGDIVHVHLFPPVFFVSLLKKLGQVRGRLVFTEHSTSNRRRGMVIGQLVDTITYMGYEQVVAISAGVEQELIKWKPGLKGKTRVIHNGVNLQFTQVVDHPTKPRLKVVSVGNLRPMKNYKNAIKAVALLKDLDFEYHIAGMGECQDELLRLCQELGLEAKVRFLGYVESVSEMLASADIFLMPSSWEGFGLAAVEAMNASLPLVISDVAGLREIVGGGDCAVLVKPKSPKSIADGLRQLLNSSDKRCQLGETAFILSQKFSEDRMVKDYISLYAEFT